MACSRSPDYDHLFKLLLIGDSGVGKSNLLLRYADDVHNKESQATIGVDFKICTRRMDGKVIKMQLWDTAGQERFRTITCSYYRGSQGIIVVYDITDRDSFNHVRQWMGEIDKYAGDGATGPRRLLVGNKVDLAAKRVVATQEGEDLAAAYGVHFLETSALGTDNVDRAFQTLVRDIRARMVPPAPAPVRPGLTLTNATPAGSGPACCT